MFQLWRKWIVYPITWVSILVVLAIVLEVVAAFRTHEADMLSFDGKYQASLVDGRVEVEVSETISLQMAGDRGITRTLPTQYHGDEIHYSDISATQASGADASGGQAPVHVTENNDNLHLRIGTDQRKSGLYTFVLTYTIDSAMVSDGTYQEIYLNTNGTDWPNGFKRYSATLELDEALRSARTGDIACYRGAAGSTARCTVQQTGNGYRVELPSGLDAYENVTIAVGFQPGTADDVLSAPSGFAWIWWQSLLIMAAVGVVALLIAVLVRRLSRRPLRSGGAIVTEYTPPENLTPLQAADLLGHPERGAAALAVWLAVEKGATLTSPDPAAGADEPDVLASIRAQNAADRMKFTWHTEDVDRRTEQVAELLFGPPDTPRPLTKQRSIDIETAQKLRDDRLVMQGWRTPTPVGVVVLVIGFLAMLVIGAIQVYLGTSGMFLPFLGGGIACVVLLAWAAHLTPTHLQATRDSREVFRQLEGLRQFIQMSEADRISWLQGVETAPRDDEGRLHLYERLLPWAIVFGEEKTWAAAIERTASGLPNVPMPDLSNLAIMRSGIEQSSDWFYRNRHRGHRDSMWGARPDIGQGWLSQFSRSAADHIATSRSNSSSGWRSSGGGGSRGGGRSGGGVGGGGGGRW